MAISGFQSTTASRVASMIAALIALMAVLTYSESRCKTIDVRLSSRIAAVEVVQQRNHEVVMQSLIDQGADIGEIKGILGRIESKIRPVKRTGRIIE